MSDTLDALPRADARLVTRMAEAAGASPEVMLTEIIRAYLGLVRGAPDALPNDPLRRSAVSANRGAAQW